MKVQRITSADNSKLKLLKKLAQKKYRDQLHLFVMENFKQIFDSLQAGHIPESLYITEEFEIENRAVVNKIAGKIDNIFFINNRLNKSFSTFDKPSGIAAVYKKNKLSNLNFKSHVVYLNGVSDPGNVGTIVRTAAAFKLNQLVFDENCADFYHPKTISAAKESVFTIKTFFDKDRQLLEQIKNNLPIVSTGLSYSQKSSALPLTNFCLILGSEGQGVEAEVKKYAHSFYALEMEKNVQSLNVAIAAGIIFYQLYKK